MEGASSKFELINKNIIVKSASDIDDDYCVNSSTCNCASANKTNNKKVAYCLDSSCLNYATNTGCYSIIISSNNLMTNRDIILMHLLLYFVNYGCRVYKLFERVWQQ